MSYNIEENENKQIIFIINEIYNFKIVKKKINYYKLVNLQTIRKKKQQIGLFNNAEVLFLLLVNRRI